MISVIFLLFGNPPSSAIEGVESARQQIRTARIEWSVRKPSLMLGSPERPFEARFITTMVGDDVATVRLADDAVTVSADGTALSGSKEQNSYLRSKEFGVWSRRENSPLADLFREGGAAFSTENMLALGIGARLGAESVHDCFWTYRDKYGAAYDETVENGMTAVTATFGDDRLKWWIDTNRKAVVRSEFVHGERIVAASRSTLAEIEGVWFPKRVEFCQSQFRGGAEPAEIVEVVDAKFNRDDISHVLTPNDIGVEVGTIVNDYAAGFVLKERLRWDGRKVVPDDKEFARPVKSGELVLGESVQKASRPRHPNSESNGGEGEKSASVSPKNIATAPASRPATFIDEVVGKWQEYTARFGKQFKLDDEQKQKAEAVGREAEDAARAYWVKHKDMLEPLLGAVQKIKESRAASQPDQARKLAELQKDLTAPFVKIFETRIEARLKSIPTRAQFKDGGNLEAAPDITP